MVRHCLLFGRLYTCHDFAKRTGAAKNPPGRTFLPLQPAVLSVATCLRAAFVLLWRFAPAVFVCSMRLLRFLRQCRPNSGLLCGASGGQGGQGGLRAPPYALLGFSYNPFERLARKRARGMEVLGW
jgi:hypothetical protein